MHVTMFHDVCWNDKENDLRIFILLKDAIANPYIPFIFQKYRKIFVFGVYNLPGFLSLYDERKQKKNC